MRPHVPTITFFRGSGLRWQEEMAGQDRGATSKGDAMGYGKKARVKSHDEKNRRGRPF